MLNQYLTNEYTQSLGEVINEIVNDPSTFLGSKYLPSRQNYSAVIRNEIIEASGGMTRPHLPGTATKNIRGLGTRVQSYSPAYYKEAIIYDEPKLMYLRELGSNDLSKRGVQSYISRDVDRLNRRIETRIEFERWNSIFTGGFEWAGNITSFNIPANNRVVPLGGVWATNGVVNNSANPIADLRYWTSGSYAPYRKYNITKIVMNGTTARWLLENANTKTYLTSYGANPSLNGYDVKNVVRFLIPGIAEVEVYNGWYQEETVVNNKIVVGDAINFIPDGYIYFETSLPGDQTIGVFEQTVQLATGTIENPGTGKFLVIEDNTVPGSQGGPGNPYINLIGGVYGGVNLQRGFDVLTAKVGTGVNGL